MFLLYFSFQNELPWVKGSLTILLNHGIFKPLDLRNEILSGWFVKVTLFLLKSLSVLELLFIPVLTSKENESFCSLFSVKYPLLS